MSSCEHSNFAIDHMVDKYVQEHFERFVNSQTEKIMKNEKENLDAEDIKNRAIEAVFENKEVVKLALKKKAALKSRRGKYEDETAMKKNPNLLLKQALLTAQLDVINKKQLMR
ncbi:hypothetical protein TcasGA2_TC033669 [Tribolium castaneum]|uniref:Uncharacterized protein n=1 Tax=Tribolium castaneum TaxID=7070 RepID=A0A139WE58_TRICA|nr:PREDICTED: uncharacterized protein LOC107398234 [Tribolium castaneum]KYB26233.1 hypothetical protein TcasGA2_TC033669 [Tribolium castaneum]|eukprot:XP_015837085.1 PREDICTED: uncharacterized protein LOC107398234 [Tribolium castaneum]